MGNLMKMREFRANLERDLREAERSVYEWGYTPALVAVRHTWESLEVRV